MSVLILLTDRTKYKIFEKISESRNNLR